MKKRVAFTMLLDGLKSGWQVPDDAIREGCDVATQLLRDSNVGARDRIRAAELLALIHERQHARLLAIAKIEGDIERADEVDRIVEGIGLMPGTSMLDVIKSLP